MEQDLYTWEGKKAGTVTVPEELFALPWNADLVHQVVTAMQSNARANTAHAKDRGEVRGGGRKPWRQKGTGRARHGSTRSPIWKGGGVTHGPSNERNYSRKINKKMRDKALLTVLSQKLRDKELIFVESGATGSLAVPKTKEAAMRLGKLAEVTGCPHLRYLRGKRALIATPILEQVMVKSFRNIPTARVEELRTVSPIDLLSYEYVIMSNPTDALKVLAERVAK